MWISLCTGGRVYINVDVTTYDGGGVHMCASLGMHGRMCM